MNSSFPVAKIHSRHHQHLQSVRKRRTIKQEQRQQKQENIRLAIETGLKMSAHIGFSILAIISIKQLLPLHSVQQEKIAEIDHEIGKIKPRVEKLEESFSTTFDPLLTRKVVQKNTYKIDPNLNPIFFIEEKP
jgi:hypothetical protein